MQEVVLVYLNKPVLAVFIPTKNWSAVILIGLTSLIKTMSSPNYLLYNKDRLQQYITIQEASLREGVVPTTLKEVVIQQLLKKPNLDPRLLVRTSLIWARYWSGLWPGNSRRCWMKRIFWIHFNWVSGWVLVRRLPWSPCMMIFAGRETGGV